MNIVVRQLQKKQNLQEFLTTLLDDVEKYFKTTQPFNEQKTYATIFTIFNRIGRDFPLISSVPNIAKRLVKDLRDKIADRCEMSGRPNKKGSGLKSFMQGIQAENDELARGSSEESQQNLNTWLKKMLLEGICQLKEDIRDADLQAAEVLSAKLYRSNGNSDTSSILFIDSFLTNDSVLAQIKGYKINRVVFAAKQIKQNQVSILDSARQLRKCKLLLISADAILRNGGILSRNGSLMLAISAQQLGIPVVAVTRSYCLWQHILTNQQSLVLEESGKSLFPQQNQSSFRVLVGKKFDYLEPKLIGSIVSENKGWQNQSIVDIFETYYH